MRAVGAALSLYEMTDAIKRSDIPEGVSGGVVSIDTLLAHQELVFRICLGHSRNFAEAEDLTQEVYLKAHQKLTGLREPALAKDWLLRIARNACLDYQKRNRLHLILLRRWVEPAVVARDAPDPDPDDLLCRLKSAVGRLPRKFRDILVLREYGHLTYDELAAALSLNKGTVMSRLNRARRKIAAALEEKQR